MKIAPYLVIIILILLLVLQWKCNNKVVSDLPIAKVDSLNTVIVKLNERKVYDSLELIASHRANDSIRNYYEGIKKNIEDKMTDQIVKLTFERNKFRTAAEAKDTAGAYVICERFMHLYDSAYLMAIGYKQTIDSLQSNGADRRFLDSTAIIGLNAMIADYQKQIAALNKFLMDAVHENNDLRMALSRTKKGRWILAALAAVAGGVIVNQIK